MPAGGLARGPVRDPLTFNRRLWNDFDVWPAVCRYEILQS